jgi:hypothetical protein
MPCDSLCASPLPSPAAADPPLSLTHARLHCALPLPICSQWFDQIVIMTGMLNRGTSTVLDVSADQDEFGHMKVALDNRIVDPMPGEVTYTSEAHPMIKFTVTERRDKKRFNVDGERGRLLHVKAGDLRMKIYMTKATKFKSERDRVRWAHLNVNIESGLPPNSYGIFAELAGIQPLSPATKKLLVRPNELAMHSMTELILHHGPPPGREST